MSNNGKLFFLFLLPVLQLFMTVVDAGDPEKHLEWKVTYGERSPLGVSQQVILINGEFPGPNLNTTSNDHIFINTFNQLDEPLLFTWNGVQQRKNTWQDGTAGTMCPIPPGTNFTFHYQVKDQIGTFYYFPSLNFHKAAGGFGGLKINSRPLIPIPFDPPETEYTVLVGDWYKQNHKELRKILDGGKSLGKPDGVLMNGKQCKAGDEKVEPVFEFKEGKTYRFRVCNAGLKNSINFRIQNHKMKLVEMDGSHTVQNIYSSLDIHLGQCWSVLVTADQEPKDYYIVASVRFTKYNLHTTGKIQYLGGKGPASNELPEAPGGWAWSLNQFRSYRWNLTASAARPNPQGSYLYGQIPIIRTVKLANTAGTVDGKLRYAINGASHMDAETPLKLAEYFGVADKVFKYDVIGDKPPGNIDKLDKINLGPIVLNFTFRDFVEIIFENHEKGIQSWHINGYSFFPVAMDVGEWNPDKRKNYNLLDAVSKHSIQVYPRSWSAVLLTFDNAGMWNLRSESAERAYLGQQLYISVVSPKKSLKDEYNIPDTALICGVVKGMPIPKPYS